MTSLDFSILNIKDEFNKHPLPEINKARNNNDDFVSDLINASNLILKFLAIAAALVPNHSLDKIQQGLLLSHMVRLFKLYDCFLLLICENRFEIAILTARPIAETAIVLKYFLQNTNKEIIDKFIKSSLAYDKKLFDLIQKKMKGRSAQPIEERMIKSIQATFEKTGFKISDINFQRDKKWHENIFVLAKNVGLEHYYETIYRVGSGAEHGAWHYLELYHLQEKNDNYESVLQYHSPSPQLLEAVNNICLNAVNRYVTAISPDDVFSEHIQTTIKWHKDISNKHEEFLLNSRLNEK